MLMCDDGYIRVICKGGMEFIIDEESAGHSGYFKRKISEGQREFDFSNEFSPEAIELLIKFLYSKSLGIEFHLESSKYALDLMFLCKKSLSLSSKHLLFISYFYFSYIF